MGKSIVLRAFAKANLSLNITGKNASSGLHTLDSVMMSLDIFDTVAVKERTDGNINVRFTNADIGAQNTAYKAASIVREAIGGGWDIEIEKGIPIGAGLGGSSADGAAVLRALDLFYGLTDRGVDMRAAALAVGSDVPFMLTGGLARVTGTGEDMFFIENKLELFVVGLAADAVSTKRAYALFDEMYEAKSYCPSDNEKLCEKLLDGSADAVEYFGNALYAPACALSPAIKDNAELLTALGATVNLTGSGGMVLGYFKDIYSFSECVSKLKGRSFYVFAPAKTGVLHEWHTS